VPDGTRTEDVEGAVKGKTTASPTAGKMVNRGIEMTIADSVSGSQVTKQASGAQSEENS